ncbi:MAG: RDD family protein [Myxococcota bacterium]
MRGSLPFWHHPAVLPDARPADLDAGRFGASLDVTIDLPLAGAGSRGLARVVDLLLLMAVQFVVAVVLGLGVVGALLVTVGFDDPSATVIGIAVGAWLLLLFVIQWGFLTWLELYTRGQTPGKKLLKLRVVRDDGGSLTLVPALLRNLLRLDAIPGGTVIDLALMLWGDQGKRLGDLAAGTVVVDESGETPPRVWPPALSAREVALLGVWFARVADLDPTRREPIAARLRARLDATHPGLVPADDSAVRALERLAPPAPVARA